jgi:predicted ATPase
VELNERNRNEDGMIVLNSKLFVVSGGPGAGKTTTLVELEKLGFTCVPEVARQIIQEQIQSGGKALPWDDREAYTALMLRRSVESFKEHTSAAQPTFFDRGIPDTLCYARLIGLRQTHSMEEACRQYRYAPQVFLAPPWKEIYHTDTERRQDFAEAERTYDLMLQTYRECGYQLIELPKAEPTLRAQFILEQIGMASSI